MTTIPTGIEILDRIARIMDDGTDDTGTWDAAAICERVAHVLQGYGRVRTCPACRVDHAVATNCPFANLHDGHWRGIPLSFPNGEPDRFDEHDRTTWFAGYIVEIINDGDETIVIQAQCSDEHTLTGRHVDLDSGHAFGEPVILNLAAVRLIEVA